MRIEADEAVRCRDRHEDVPAACAQRCDELAAIAAQLSVPAPPFRGYQALAAAEHARAGGAGGVPAWSAAAAAWQSADEPYPTAYALLRLAEAHSAAGDWEPAAAAVRRAHTVAERIGASAHRGRG